MADNHPGDTELIPSEPRSHAQLKRCTLTITEGAGAGAIFRANQPRIVIGSDPSADLVIDERTVSRFHCEITLRDGSARIRDLDSRNGTRVDGVRIEAALLGDPCTVTLGRAAVRFERDTSHFKISLSEDHEFGLLVGRSPAMRAVFATLKRAAETDATVLIEGETGTGKEATAESIHRESARSGGPFIFVDCGAIPPDLLESELFGHEKGAFTGAVVAREGAFEAAHGGTIFLDELGELPAELQPRLLRVLERRHVKRVGANRYRDIDVRVIAATNRDMRAAVNAKHIRSDLYYRLAVIEVVLPPLRERPEDLPLLVDRLLRNLGVHDRPEARSLTTDEFIAHLARHPWPGNVRELRNYLERCLAMRERMPLDRDGASPDADPRDTFDDRLPLKSARDRWNHAFELRYLETVLTRNGGNVSAAARDAEVDRAYFHRLLRRHGLR